LPSSGNPEPSKAGYTIRKRKERKGGGSEAGYATGKGRKRKEGGHLGKR
jgi:hypothetical protein